MKTSGTTSFLASLLVSSLFTAAGQAGQTKCDNSRMDVLREIDKARKCAKDSDCALVSFECPFGCGTPVNSQKGLDKILASIDAYHKACKQCAYDCELAKGDLRCISQRCELVPKSSQEIEAIRVLKERLVILQKRAEDLSVSIKEQVKRPTAEFSEKSDKKLKEDVRTLQDQAKTLLMEIDEQRQELTAEAQDKMSDLITKMGKKLEELGQRIKPSK